jgi:hypothetical protein
MSDRAAQTSMHTQRPLSLDYDCTLVGAYGHVHAQCPLSFRRAVLDRTNIRACNTLHVLLSKQSVVLDETNNRIHMPSLPRTVVEQGGHSQCTFNILRLAPGASTAPLNLENDCMARSEVRMWCEGGGFEAEDERVETDCS